MSEKFSFDDFMLRRAMKQIMDYEVAALPSDIELVDNISVSDEFREKMSVLTKQSRRRLTLMKTMKAVAAIFIGAVLIFSVEQMMENEILFKGDEAGAPGAAPPAKDEPAEAAPVDSSAGGVKTDSFEEDEEYEYINYTNIKNDIDDIMVDRVNDAGNHGSEASLRENEDIYYLAWRAEYYRLTDHLGKKRMEEPIRPRLEGNGDRSRYNLEWGEKYREECLSLLDSMDKSDDYRIHFNESYYKALESRVETHTEDDEAYGVWLVKKVTGYGYIMHTTEEDDNQYLGSIVVLNKNNMYEYFPNAGDRFDGSDGWKTEGLIKKPRYKVETIDNNDMIHLARIRLKNLRIKKDKTKIVTAKIGKEEDDYPFVYFIVRDKKHLIVMGESFYLAERLDIWPRGAD